MNDRHLSDEDIQCFILDKAGCHPGILAHMQQCTHCSAKAEAYSHLFSAIKEQPKPIFDFDLSAAVLKKLSSEKSAFSFNSFPGYLIIFSALAGIGVPAFLLKIKIVNFFKTYVFSILSGLSTMVICLLLITMMTILLFQFIEMYKKYQRKINDLNFY
jgi:hypothetical protein